MPGINHHPVPDRVLPKKWPWVQSFCRDHSRMLEGLIECIYIYIYFFFFSIDSFCRDSCSNFWGYPGTCEES